MGYTELFQLARRQHDVVTRRCAQGCGIDVTTFDRLRRRERWPAPFPGTAIVPGGDPRAPLTRIAAAVLSVGAPAAVGGTSALYVHGLRQETERDVELWVPPRRRPGDMPGRVIRRSALLDFDAVPRVSGIPVVAAPEAIAQVAGRMPVDRLRDAAIDARFRGLLPDGALGELVEADPHRAGRAELREVAHDLAGDGSDSGFEHRARHRLIEAGLDPAPAPVRIRTPAGVRAIDIGFPPVLVGIECVGFAYHSTRAQLERDAVRQNEIATLDRWLILQLTWAMLYGTAWHRFVAQVRQAIRERSTAV